MKPVVLPMLHLLLWHRLGVGQNGEGLAWDVRMLAAAHAQHALEFVRKNLDEARARVLPIVKNPLRARTPGQLQVARNETTDDLHILSIEQRLKINGIQIA